MLLVRLSYLISTLSRRALVFKLMLLLFYPKILSALAVKPVRFERNIINKLTTMDP